MAGSRLFEAIDRGVHSLSGSGEGASGQDLHLLGVSDFGAGVDDFLSDLLKFSGEGSKLKNFSLDKRIPQLLDGSVDDRLVRLPGFEDTLSKGIERRMHTIARSCPQFDCEHRVSFAHGEVGAWADVVEYKSHVFGFPFIVVGVVDGRRDAKSPVGPIFDKRGSWVHVTRRVVDNVLIHAGYYDWRSG